MIATEADRRALRMMISEARRARARAATEAREIERERAAAARRPRWLLRAIRAERCAYCGDSSAPGVCAAHADLLDVDPLTAHMRPSVKAAA